MVLSTSIHGVISLPDVTTCYKCSHWGFKTHRPFSSPNAVKKLLESFKNVVIAGASENMLSLMLQILGNLIVEFRDSATI